MLLLFKMRFVKKQSLDDFFMSRHIYYKYDYVNIYIKQTFEITNLKSRFELFPTHYDQCELVFQANSKITTVDSTKNPLDKLITIEEVLNCKKDEETKSI